MIRNYEVYSKQITQRKQVVGYVTLYHYDYGYVVKLHFLEIPGYLENKTFPTRQKAETFLNKLYNEYNY